MTLPERYLLHDVLASPAVLGEVGQRLVQGAVCVYPTETIYGVGGRSDSEDVRQRIISAKGKAPDAPMVVVAASRASLDRLGVEFPGAADALAAAFWPGRLTLVLPVKGSGAYLGVRVCAHAFVVALASVMDTPLFSTSANLSGEPYDGDPRRIERLFASRVGFMVDAGCLPPSRPSTVVKVTRAGVVETLREGAVSRQEVSEAARGSRPDGVASGIAHKGAQS
jgi:L-threonylcarbamoyladenylate synthase